MTKQSIQIDLTNEEKTAVLKYADLFIFDEQTKSDLNNKRKKWIHFTHTQLELVIGELSYHFNRCKNDYQFHFLDNLIGHLEYHERISLE